MGQFLGPWKAAGADCSVVPLEEADPARAADADLVVLQKKLPSFFPFRALRRRARRLIYEFDDAVMFGRDGAEARPSWTRMGRFRRVVRGADAVTTSNTYLAKLAAEAGGPGPVRVFPNAVDEGRWKPGPVSPAARRIGWYGSPANLGQLRALAGPLGRLQSERPGLEFVVVSERPPEVPGVRVVHVPYDAAAEVGQVAGFDVAVAPMDDTPWTRGKSPVKLLCYLACGVPVVASDVPPHRALLADGITGFLATDEADWERKLAVVLDDAAVRERFRRAGLDLVSRFYGAGAMAKEYLKFYGEVAGR